MNVLLNRLVKHLILVTSKPSFGCVEYETIKKPKYKLIKQYIYKLFILIRSGQLKLERKLTKTGRKMKKYATFDDSVLDRKADIFDGSIMKKQVKIIKELRGLLQNSKEASKKKLQIDEAIQASKEYRAVSDRITLLTIRKQRSKPSYRMTKS